jgi:hypothetical protein
MLKYKELYFNVSVSLLLILFSGTVFSLDTDRAMTVTVHASDQESIDIGHVTFTEEDGGYRYQFALDQEKFEKQFLSMRPFDCIQKPEMMVCHLPYPYQNNKFISADDMADLEYELMFLHKYPGAYGIDPWNGIYYKMQLTEKGIEGVLHDVDMKVLTAPPDEGNLRPLTHKMLYEANPAKHWFYTLTIQ